MSLEAFGLGFGFAVVVMLTVVWTLHHVGLLKNHGDVTNRFEAHRELVNGTLDLMRERAEMRMNALHEIVEIRSKADLDPIRKDLEDARAGVLNLAHRLDAIQDKYEQLTGMQGLGGEGKPVPTDMEVVGGGAIGND